MTTQERIKLFRDAALESVRIADRLNETGHTREAAVFLKIATIERAEVRRAIKEMK